MPNLERIDSFASELTAIRHDIHAHPEIGFEEHRTSGIVAEKLQQWGIELPVPAAGARYGLVTFALKAAEAGVGAALLPDYACVDSLAAGKVVQLNRASPRTRRGYYLVVSPERRQSPAIAALRGWLVAEADTTIPG